MSELADSVPPGHEETGRLPAVAPAAGDESTPNGTVDYITPPSKKVIAVAVRYCRPTKGTPMPYDLAAADDES